MIQVQILTDLMTSVGYTVKTTKRGENITMVISLNELETVIKGSEEFIVSSVLAAGVFPVQTVTNPLLQNVVDTILAVDLSVTKAVNGNKSQMTKSRNLLKNVVSAVKDVRNTLLDMRKSKDVEKV